MARIIFVQQKLASLAASAKCSGRQPPVRRPNISSTSGPGLQDVVKSPVLWCAAHMHPSGSDFGSTWIEGSDLSEKPSASADVLFYTHTLCPYAHRVHPCLLEKVICHSLRVPVLVCGALFDAESLQSPLSDDQCNQAIKAKVLDRYFVASCACVNLNITVHCRVSTLILFTSIFPVDRCGSRNSATSCQS